MQITELYLSQIYDPVEVDGSSEAVQQLLESITSQGLLHPITVTPPDDKGYHRIISGRRRYRAYAASMGKLGDRIPAIIRDVSSKESNQITTIHENLYRFNLPWYEQVQLETELHKLRQDEHGIGKQGKKVGWSLRDTAKELDMSFGVLSEDIKMAEAVWNDPTLKKIQNKDVARRIILTNLKRLSQEADASGVVPISELELNHVYHGSAEIVLKAFPDNTFAGCITDPPWIKFKDEKYTKDEFTISVFSEIYRVMKNNSILYACISTEDFPTYLAELTKMKFNVQKYPIMWVKEGYMTRGKRAWEYERDYEPILVACKGAPALTSNMPSSVLSFKIVPPVKMVHPNEKPVSLIKKLIGDCSFPGSIILDPFAGSGVLGEACNASTRKWVMIERDPTHYKKICDRIGQKE